MPDEQLSWVTKTDMTRYVRCPYSFWLLDTGQILFEDTIDEFQAGLLTAGYEFEDAVVLALPALEIPPGELMNMLVGRVTLLNTPDFDNEALRIRGRPDGIEGGDGALYPIEVKSHRDVQALDELELAFYWLLLEPFRTRHDANPEGRLILRRGGEPHTVSVQISPDRLSRAAALIDRVRVARLNGVEPRVCRCRVCSTLKRDEVVKSVTRRKDVTMIYGVAGTYADLLYRFGFKTWASLLDVDCPTLALRFAASGYRSVTARVIERWKLHAQAYEAQTPVLSPTAQSMGLGNRYIALDLEYESWIWLIGACIVNGDEREYHFLWADTPEEELANLETLFTLVNEHQEFPVITWSGTSADIPSLRKASARHGATESLQPLISAHRDLFRWAEDNLRVPVPQLGLKQLERYFGVARTSDVVDGLEAVLIYQRYLRTRDPDLRQRLINYNRDDVDSLILVAEELKLIGEAAGLQPAFQLPKRPPQDQLRKISVGELVRAELEVVPRGSPNGPERLYRALYANYRMKSLGRNSVDLVPTQEAAHEFALREVRTKFRVFEPQWALRTDT